ncbi:hypothetical protein [Sorangium sp. So ce362]|uniref:hypothetical protein n=1 Tax=Sorangium sp. So ce362 TaxID=3133303 RepID=UPI003F5E0538
MIVGIAICTLTACNWTVGDCYPREEWEKGEGAGGPVGPPVPIFSSGASGDFGAAPPDGPQDGDKEKIQCNKTEDEDEEESPSDSSERPTASPESPPDPCQQSGAPQMGCNIISVFEPSMFQFVTIVADDGTVAGGWQEAKAGLVFRRGGRGVDACMVHIGMPLRTVAWGEISAERAALISSDLVNRIAAKFYEEGLTDLPPGIFCDKFKAEMRHRFEKAEDYKGLGTRLMN